jgi:hypothetical protein
MTPRRFKHWIYLNDEGKKLYDSVFNGKDVPVISMIPTAASIAGHSERVYLLYHEELSDVEIDLLLTLLSEKFSAPKEAIKQQMLKDRIPIREKYVSGSGTNHPGLFM